MTILHIIFGVLTFGLAIFGLLTKNFDYQYLMFFSMSVVMLVMGIKEFRLKRKANGYSLVLVAAFALFVAIQGFVLF